MSRHRGPDFFVPEEERCEAIVKGVPSYHWQWMRIDHRCPRKANQSRGFHVVCHIHARAKQVNFIAENQQDEKSVENPVNVLKKEGTRRL